MKFPEKTVLLLVNPSSGQRRVSAVIHTATHRFSSAPWKLLVKVLSGPGEAYVLAAQAARKGHYAVLVAGGDGTINEVARALAGRKTALGIIPAGTGNGFARNLKIPLEIERACDVAAQGRIFKADIGVLDKDRVFVSICGAGFDAFAAQRANQLRWVNRFSGFLRYLFSGILASIQFRPPNLRVRVDSRSYDGPCLLVSIANGKQYGFGATIAPAAELDDGRFDVVIMRPGNLLDLLRNCFRLYTKKPLLNSAYLSGKKISIQGLDGRESPVHIDGESSGASPVKISVRHRCLSVFVP